VGPEGEQEILQFPVQLALENNALFPLTCRIYPNRPGNNALFPFCIDSYV
jgi:hypothetical protein